MDNKKNILYVLHSGTSGGTFDTTLDLIKNLKDSFNIYILGAENDHFILYNYCEGKVNTITVFQRYDKWSAKTFHNSWLTYIYFEILTEYNIDLIHIMHLINHSFDLPQIAKKLKIPIILSFHDYYFVCPNFCLLNENYEYCGGICSDNHENCKLNWNIFDDIHFKTFLPTWREHVQNLFKYVDVFISSSPIVKNIFSTAYPNMKTIFDSKFIIIEHGRDFPKFNQVLFDYPSRNAPLKIAFPANQLNEMKGSEIIKDIKKLDKKNELEFHFLGNVPESLEEYGINHGPYLRDDFNNCIEEIKPSFIGIFSICPETYCHTLTESWNAKIPVIGTNVGVIEDRISKNKGGIIIDRNIQKCYSTLINLKNLSKKDYESLLDDVSKIFIKTTADMAKEYLNIYDSLLKST